MGKQENWFWKNNLQNTSIHPVQFHGNILMATEQAHTTYMGEINKKNLIIDFKYR